MIQLHSHARYALQLLRLRAHPRGFRTVKQWQQLRNAFARWPRRLVLQSDRTTWMSCLRCKRAYPAAVMRGWCFDCSGGRPLLTLQQVEAEHATFGWSTWFTPADERGWFVLQEQRRAPERVRALGCL